MSKNYLNLPDFRAAYTPKDDAISLTSADPELAAAGFRMTLQKHTKAERILRAKLEAAGLLRLPVGDFPALITYSGDVEQRRAPWQLLPLGVDRSGARVGIDILEGGTNLLVAGQTGSGKSVLLHTLLAHAAAHLDRWQVSAIDLMRTEFGPLAGESSLREAFSIATDWEAIATEVARVHELMFERYAMLEERGLRHAASLIENHRLKAHMLVIEEAYVLLSRVEPHARTGQQSQEGLRQNVLRDQIYGDLLDISRLGRAAGVFLVIGTQRFDYSVLPPEFVNNLENRVLLGRSDARRAVQVLDWIPREIKDVPKGRGHVSLLDERDELQFYFSDRNTIIKAALNSD